MPLFVHVLRINNKGIEDFKRLPIENGGHFLGAFGSHLVARCRAKVVSRSLHICLIYRWQNVPKNIPLRPSLVGKIYQL